MNTLEGFFKNLQEDESLKNSYNRLINKRDTKELLELLEQNGVSSSDIDSFIITIKDMEDRGELSDDMLDYVSGGGMFSGFKSLISILSDK